MGPSYMFGGLNENSDYNLVILIMTAVTISTKKVKNEIYFHVVTSLLTSVR